MTAKFHTALLYSFFASSSLASLSFVSSIFVSLIFLTPVIAVAETNIQGDEIIIQNDSGSDSNADIPISPSLSLDPALNYLPDQTADGTSSDEDLRQRIINGYAMPNLDSSYTSVQESWYSSRPDYVRRMISRSQKYLYHIVVEVEKRGMPSEIALLPMVESAYNPQAYSKSRASGIWQFIPSTGKNFGLKQNWWVDNRRDVTEATNAALNYLQKLHSMFGSWDLALAAYNAGEGTVQRAIDRNRKKGLPTDYASLPLPPETRNYVPKLQAVKNIMSDPEHYGLSIEPIANKPYFTKVRAPQQIDAALAAKLAEISFEEFSSLNPEYNRPVITANGTVHDILLPISAAEVFQYNLSNYDKPLVSWQTYHAKRGERTDYIARKFGIDLAKLKDINDLPSRNKLSGSRPLLVPSNGNNAESSINTDEPIPAMAESNDADSDGRKSPARFHVVKNKETIATIAQHYGMSARALLAANHLKNNHVRPGQKLVITESANAGSAKPNGNKKEAQRLARNNTATDKASSKKTSAQYKYYVVRHGDTLESIARKFDVGRDRLQRWNKISGSHLAPGHILTVHKSDDA